MLSVAALANNQKLLTPGHLKTIMAVASEADIVTWNLFKKMLYANQKMPSANITSEVGISQNEAERKFLLDQNEELKKQIKELEEQLKAKEHKQDSFSFLSILDYVTKNCFARNCDPILEMLNDMCVKAKDWKKVEKITEVKQKMAEANVKVVNNYNTIQNSNAFLGQVNNPQFLSNPQYTIDNGK